MQFNNYDVVVIGAGHAGIEAALAAARLNKKTAIFTIYADNVGMMSCNPAIGGPGKSHLISEIDVLGAEIGKHTDKYNLQLKHLNESKGLASRVTRAQADKYWYRVKMKEIIENTLNLDLIQEKIEDIIIENNEVSGVISSLGIIYHSKKVIVATGTFLCGRIVVGETEYKAGRQGEESSEKLSENLKKHGVELERFQTATPPRIDKRSIDFTKVKELYGAKKPKYFSIHTKKIENINLPTWLTFTSEDTVKVVKELLQYSPIVTGIIDTHGPRHCPSLDRKVLNFPEKTDHQIFLEQESKESNEIYVNGLTTAMPPFAQKKILQTIRGLENANIMRYGYGIEYDYAPSYQLYHTLENKKIKGLYFAGQVNGTSGYEEAASQGFLAGINAARSIDGKEDISFDRSDGYIGVMLDDIINKKMVEPYRILPSRVEYKLSLRQDNSFMRLLDKAKEIGIISKEKLEYYEEVKKAVQCEIQRLKNEKIYPSIENNLVLEGMGEGKIKKSISGAELLQRKNIRYNDLKYLIEKREYPDIVIEQVEINIKYATFIEREKEQIKKFKILEEKKIPKKFDYKKVKGLSKIALAGLENIKPKSVGQASRITGIGGQDIALIIASINNEKKK